MPAEQNHYEVLGLPRTAAAAAIKRRYRELARRYHPDVVKDKAAGAKVFVRINEAYETLMDPEKRRAYDASLPSVTQIVYPAGPTGQNPGSRLQEVQKLVKDAESVFAHHRHDEAAQLCKKAVSLDMTCSRAHAILGDIYKTRKLYDHAINEYNYAVQFDPSDKLSEKKLEKLLRHADPTTFSWERPGRRLSTQAIVMNIVAWGVALFALLLIYIYPGKPVVWFANPVFTLDWSWNLIGIVIGDSVLVGLLLGLNGIIAHPDEELIFENGGRGWGLFPTGLIVLMISPVFFLGSAILYMVLSFIQDTISWSVVKVFVAIIAIVLISAALYPQDRTSVLLFGGNLSFIGMLCGWYLGAMFRAEA